MKICIGICYCGGRVEIELREVVELNRPTRLAQAGAPACEKCGAVPILNTVDAAGNRVVCSGNPYGEAAKLARPLINERTP